MLTLPVKVCYVIGYVKVFVLKSLFSQTAIIETTIYCPRNIRNLRTLQWHEENKNLKFKVKVNFFTSTLHLLLLGFFLYS